MSSAAGAPGTHAGSNCKLKRASVYKRRWPERSAAYQVVRENLETWLQQRRAGRLVAGANWVIDPVPGYVERDLREFLECGSLAHGFARARCEQCGKEVRVAYSCKGRGMCPGCNTRRMVETAAHMVEHVFPAAAVRQWVVVFPERVRYY